MDDKLETIINELREVKEELANLRYLTHTVAIIVKALPIDGSEPNPVELVSKLKELFKEF